MLTPSRTHIIILSTKIHTRFEFNKGYIGTIQYHPHLSRTNGQDCIIYSAFLNRFQPQCHQQITTILTHLSLPPSTLLAGDWSLDLDLSRALAPKTEVRFKIALHPKDPQGFAEKLRCVTFSFVYPYISKFPKISRVVNAISR